MWTKNDECFENCEKLNTLDVLSEQGKCILFIFFYVINTIALFQIFKV